MSNNKDKKLSQADIDAFRRINRVKPSPPRQEQPSPLPFDDFQEIPIDDRKIHPILRDNPDTQMSEAGGCVMTAIIMAFTLLFLLGMASLWL